jgi:hypothetical protein
MRAQNVCHGAEGKGGFIQPVEITIEFRPNDETIAPPPLLLRTPDLVGFDHPLDGSGQTPSGSLQLH